MDAPGTNQTYKTSNGDAQAYTAEDNLYPGILYIALVRGVANDSDQFEHEGVWSTQQLFSVTGKSNNFFFIHFLDLAHQRESLSSISVNILCIDNIKNLQSSK